MTIINKYSFLIILVCLALNGFSQTNAKNTVSDFTVTDITGNTHHLYEYLESGKFVCVDFFGTDCTFCQELVPVLDSVYNDYGCNDYDVVFIAINYHDSNADVILYENLYPSSYPKVSGLEGGGYGVFTQWNIEYWPQILLISPDKTIASNINPINYTNIDVTFSNFGITKNECNSFITSFSTTQSQYEISPNPATNQINIFFNRPNESKNTPYQLLDAMGKVVFQGILISDIIRLSPDLEQGIYYLNLENYKTQKLLIIK